MKVRLNGEPIEFDPNGISKGIVGTIIPIAVNPLNNKLVLAVSWGNRISQDETDRYRVEFDIKINQWHEIIDRDLIGKEVEFDLLDENKLLVKVTYPDIPYTEKEVEKLVAHAWIAGYNDCDNTGGRRVAKNSPSEFWEANRKKK